jgi:hypothetical protein
MMNWQAGTASQVADQLEQEFHDHVRKTGRLQALLGVTQLEIESEPHKNEPATYIVNCHHNVGQDQWRCNVIIYATGFGVERADDSHTVPYWRNDLLGQLDLHADGKSITTYVVSGIGDSGLTDLFRLKILNFRHERIFYELFNDASPELIGCLRDIQSSFRTKKKSTKDWLFLQFEELMKKSSGAELARSLSQLLTSRMRNDTLVILNGSPKLFCDALDLDRSSLSNALLAFLLFKLDAFEYRSGRLTKRNKNWAFGSGASARKLPRRAHLIMRHGPEREIPLRSVKLEWANKVLKKRAATSFNTAEQIFEPGWWAQNRVDLPSSAGAEFVPPITVTLASTFVNTLADILSDRLFSKAHASSRKGDSPQFRVTLHRVARFAEKEMFHQIAPYAGRPVDHQIDSLGRIFTIEGGLVGIAIRNGRPVIFRRDPSKFEEMKTRIHFEKLLAHPIRDNVSSMIATPFFVRSPTDTEKLHVAFVMFADSSELDFFNSEMLKTIYAACTGFVRNVESMLESGRLREVSSEYTGYQVPDAPLSDAYIQELESIGIKIDSVEIASYKEALTFKKLRSFEFDIGLGRFILPLAS